MKTRLISSCKLTAVLAGLAMVVGLLKGSEPAANPDAASTPPPSAAAPGDSSPAAATPPSAINPPAPAANPPLAPAVNLTPGAADIARLAQSGLGDNVMLAYVGNANARFNLGSDQIVYLNDLGVSGDVVKAMIQRDASLDAAAQAAAASLAAASMQPPAAPYPTNYVDPNSYANTPPPVDPTMPPPDTGDYAPPNDADYFYSSLAPYGSWYYVAGLGLCWSPTVGLNTPGWQPYHDRGRWLYTDCGWYWRSDYSWGWAAFHYGRWFRDAAGNWTWAPNRVWGPAWVSWRHSAEYSGWAALPPSARFVPGSGFYFNNRPAGANFEFGLQAANYTFIPTARLGDYTPARYAVASWKAGEVYRQTALANHFKVQNNRVVSESIDPDEVSALAHTPLRRAEIRDLPGGADRSLQADRLAKAGNQLVMLRPPLPSPTPARAGGAVLPQAHGYYPSANNAGQSQSQAYPPRASTPLYFTSHSPPSAAAENYPAGSMVVIGNRTGNTVAASYNRTPNQPVYQPAQGGRTYQVFDTGGRNPAQNAPAENQPYVMGARYSVAQRLNTYSANRDTPERSEQAQEHENHEAPPENHAPVAQHSNPAPAPAPHAAPPSSNSGSGKK